MYVLVLLSASGLADLSAYVLVCWHMSWTRGHAVSFRYGCPVGYVLSASACAVLSASVPFILSVSSRSVHCPFFFLSGAPGSPPPSLSCSWLSSYHFSISDAYQVQWLHIRFGLLPPQLLNIVITVVLYCSSFV